jgi:predicted DCC family thiol-disulfide oxidoreductase YuxK
VDTAAGGEHPIILFDGVCVLCNRSVRHIIRNDPAGRFRMAALQSAAGRRLLTEHGLDPDALDTVVLIERGRVYTRSDAALRILRGLSGPSRHWWLARFVPRPVRDAAYGLVVRNRYQWFGKRSACMTPRPIDRHRFLDAHEKSTALQ